MKHNELRKEIAEIVRIREEQAIHDRIGRS